MSLLVLELVPPLRRLEVGLQARRLGAHGGRRRHGHDRYFAILTRTETVWRRSGTSSCANDDQALVHARRKFAAKFRVS